MTEPVPSLEADIAAALNAAGFSFSIYPVDRGCLVATSGSVIPLDQILCFKRAPGVRHLDPTRATNILQAIKTGTPIPPIQLRHLPKGSETPFALYDGYHRFQLAKALGYSSAMAIVVMDEHGEFI